LVEANRVNLHIFYGHGTMLDAPRAGLQFDTQMTPAF
jgi:hypothetical protein